MAGSGRSHKLAVRPSNGLPWADWCIPGPRLEGGKCPAVYNCLNDLGGGIFPKLTGTSFGGGVGGGGERGIGGNGPEGGGIGGAPWREECLLEDVLIFRNS